MNDSAEQKSSTNAKSAISRLAAIIHLAAALVVVALVVPGAAYAQLPLHPAGAPFDMVGFIQKATLDSPGDVLAGGTLVVNGHTVTVPRNTIMQMPAFALTWQQLFAQAPAPYGPSQTGLAMTDTPTPLTTYEVHVQGNRIGDQYIAGLIFMSQQSLNAGQGHVNYIDYANAELHVGGIIGDPNTGTRVKINDPIGRFAPAYTGDQRFTIDEDNPTVRTETAYPMCFPHLNPASGPDRLCPQANRPIDPSTGQYASIFTMPPTGGAAGTADPMFAAPFEIGDYISYAGTLMKDGPQPTAGPMPANGLAGTYIAAHTIIANLGIFTTPGTDPAYVATDVMLLGVGGLPIDGLDQEATGRTRFEGFATDTTRPITLWGMDVDACTSDTFDRDWGMINVDPGPPTGIVKGRWRFRPPNGVSLMPSSGAFLPATRMMRSVSNGHYYPGQVPVISGNGLITGQYAAPIFDFLFPENLGIGNRPVPANFNEFPFLVNGTFGAVPGVNAGQLFPFPNVGVPAQTCGRPPVPAPPTANAGPAQSVASGATVTLDGSASSDPSALAIAWTWTQVAGPTVTLNTFFAEKPTFVAPTVAASTNLRFQLIVTNSDGLQSNPSLVTITVAPAAAVATAPTANAGAAQSVGSGATVQLNGTASADTNVPAQALTYAWTQTSGTAVVLSSLTSASPTFKAPSVTVATNLVFSLVVRNTTLSSAASTVTISVKAIVAPVANAGPNQTVAVGALVNLTAAASTDPNGLPLTYSWIQTTGTAVALTGATTATPTFTAPGSPAVGPFTFKVTVSNGTLSSSATVTITVTAATDTVTATAVYLNGKRKLTITATSSVLDGSAILSAVGLGANGANATMIFGGGGTYTLVIVANAAPSSGTVTVISSLGGSATAIVTFK